MGRFEMSPWARGPKNSWRTVHKRRHDQHRDIDEEVEAQRSFYLGLIVAAAACVASWFWQAWLDVWPRAIVLTIAIALTTYLTIIGASFVGFALLARFVRKS